MENTTPLHTLYLRYDVYYMYSITLL